jgi:hypothetical protein
MNRTEEFVRYNNLFDLYGNLLTDNEKEIFILFYEEDLSLQEIAIIRNVSKSFVGKVIKTINKKLDASEEKLKFFTKTKNILNEIEKTKNKDLLEKITKIIES